MPIDPTPGEKAWFDDLTKEMPFACHWYGLTQLDALMARHPEVVTYFFSNGHRLATELLTRLKAEQAALAKGVPDAIERIKDIGQQLNQIDPFYRVSLKVDTETGDWQARLIPKYRDAPRDRAINVTLELVVSSESDEKSLTTLLASHMDFGRQVTIPSTYVRRVVVDAPAGLSQQHEGVGIVLGPNFTNARVGELMMVRIESPDHQLLATMSVECRSATAGHRGMVISFADRNDVCTVEVKAARDGTGTISITSKGAELMPEELLPVYRFFNKFCAPNLIVLTSPSGTPITDPGPLRGDAPLVDDAMCQMVETLSRIQEKCGVRFPMPKEFTASEITEIQVIDAIASGRVARGRWNGRVTSLVTRETAKEFIDASTRDGNELPPMIDVSNTGNVTMSAGGNNVPLGVVTLVYHGAVLRNRDAVVRAIGESAVADVITMEFETLEEQDVDAWLGGPDERPLAP